MPTDTSPAKISICITTRNRADFIGGTLESILNQATTDCEVIVLDAASTDDTDRIVSGYACRFDCLRYVRQDTNNGIDRDYDRVVELATGQYCWLMSDDDLLKPGAVAGILDALRRDLSLVVMNVELRNFSMSKVVQRRWLDITSDRVYKPEESDRLFVDLGERLWYVGGVIIKRSIWLTRERQRYCGSWFIYVGVIFQQQLPGDALVLAEPSISFRLGNSHTFSPHLFEIIWFKWPSLIWSLSLSDFAKARISGPEPWRSLRELLILRGLGCYSLTEYCQHIRPRLRSIHEPLTLRLIAMLPGTLVNAYFVLYYSLTSQAYHGWRQPGMMLHSLANCRFYYRNLRVLKASVRRPAFTSSNGDA